MNRLKTFLDTEFTGLHQGTTLISIGLVTEKGDSFYAELINYDKAQIDDWLQANVIDNLILDDFQDNELRDNGKDILLKCDSVMLRKHLGMWLETLGPTEIWSDCLAFDWVLFNNIFGHAFNIPKNVLYIPYDICTQFRQAHVCSDISREEFINYSVDGRKHNALYDAKVIRACHDKLELLLAK